MMDNKWHFCSAMAANTMQKHVRTGPDSANNAAFIHAGVNVPRFFCKSHLWTSKVTAWPAWGGRCAAWRRRPSSRACWDLDGAPRCCPRLAPGHCCSTGCPEPCPAAPCGPPHLTRGCAQNLPGGLITAAPSHGIQALAASRSPYAWCLRSIVSQEALVYSLRAEVEAIACTRA